MIKFMYADDYVRDKLKFPVILEPKVDGVRGGHLNDWFTARTLRKFSNLHTCNFFSQKGFKGFDGELAANSETHPRLCHLTTSATNTIEGQPWLMLHVFDYVLPETLPLPYIARLQMAHDKVEHLKTHAPELGCHLQMMPWTIVHNLDELDAVVEQHIDQGYEGTIVRKIDGPYKQGRSTVKEGYLLRIKPYIEVDFTIDEIVEGQRNENEARISLTGHTERSTHAENMVPNGMVGAFKGTLCEDVLFNGSIIHKKGDPIRVSAGKLTHEQRALFFVRQDLALGKRGKVQIFPRGIKDKPRHPTFQSFRSDEDTVVK